MFGPEEISSNYCIDLFKIIPKIRRLSLDTWGSIACPLGVCPADCCVITMDPS